MLNLVNAKIEHCACILRVLMYSVFFCTKNEKVKKNVPGYFAAPSHKNLGGPEGVKIAFKVCLWVFKRGRTG